MQSLTRKIREYALQHDPEATFSGEPLWNLEIDSGYLDFTASYDVVEKVNDVIGKVTLSIAAQAERAGEKHVDMPFGQAVLRHPEAFVGTLTEKMLMYSLGRSFDYRDMPTVRAIVHDAARLPEVVARAFAIASAPTPGPTVIVGLERNSGASVRFLFGLKPAGGAG